MKSVEGIFEQLWKSGLFVCMLNICSRFCEEWWRLFGYMRRHGGSQGRQSVLFKIQWNPPNSYRQGPNRIVRIVRNTN